MKDKEILMWVVVFFGLGILWGNIITTVFSP